MSEEHRVQALGLLAGVRAGIEAAAGGDDVVRFQMRRYIAKRLEFDERGTPTERRRLKAAKVKYQRGLCAMCAQALPERGAELHRVKAMDGYTAANTMLLCRGCHERMQASDVSGVRLDFDGRKWCGVSEG